MVRGSIHSPVRNSASGDKLCNYKLIKSCSDTAGYVLAPLQPWPEMGGSFAACRVLSAGRERVCKLCNSGKIETEFHSVMECSELQNLRNELIFTVTKRDRILYAPGYN